MIFNGIRLYLQLLIEKQLLFKMRKKLSSKDGLKIILGWVLLEGQYLSTSKP
jgi:hypothetical protein